MKKFKKLSTALIFILALALLSAPILAVAASNDWFAATKSGSSVSQPIKYENPSLSAVSGEGLEPEPMEPDAADISADKKWYECITYSNTAILTVEENGLKYEYFDPYDYNNGTIMRLTDTNIASVKGEKDLNIPCPFSSANQVDVTWSTSKAEAHEWSSEFALDIAPHFEYELATVKWGMEFTVHLGHSQGGSTETERGVEMTQSFSAVHYNASGAPYQWKVVHYEVMMPIKVDVSKKLDDGSYVLSETGYMLNPTVQGTCREYIKNGVTYIEDWRTGEGIPLDDFWAQYMTPEKLKKAYDKNLLPTE